MSESQEEKALRAELAQILEEIKRMDQEIKRKDQEIKRKDQEIKRKDQNPVEYDEFSATVDLVATFIPNERLRAIRNWQPDSHEVDKLADFLRAEYHFALSLVHIAGGSEASPVDPNLRRVVKKNLQLRLNTASYFLKPVREGYKGDTFAHEPCQHRSILPSRLDHIFRIYDRLHDHYTRLTPRPTDWSISFPVGCITVPSQESTFRANLIAAIRQQPLFNSLIGQRVPKGQRPK
eukprot:gene5801-4158_t